MRRTLALSLTIGLSLSGLSPIGRAIAPNRSFSLFRPSPVWAQTSSRLAWTQPYANAVDEQTELSTLDAPLEQTLTRIEFARWLVKTFRYEASPERTEPLVDMPSGNRDYWTAQAVLQSGVMRAFEGNEFRPSGNLTKLEALAIAVRALEVPSPPDPEVDRWMELYQDADVVPDIGRPFIAMAGQTNLLVNVPTADRLQPNLILSRGEGAVLIHRILAYRQQIDDIEPPIAQVAPEVLADPELFAIRVWPETGPVREGETLTVEAQGTPGGQAKALVGNQISIAMAEDTPGRYRGTYTPTSSDFIASPAVTIDLSLNGSTTRIQRQYPDLALGSALANPSETASTPESTPPPPNSPPRPSTNPPNNLSIPTPPPIDTPPSLPSATSSASIPEGERRPLLPELTAIRISPSQGDLQTGEILTVEAQGQPGAVVQFDLGRIVQGQPMLEAQPGVYQGTYVIASIDQISNPYLRVVLSSSGKAVQHEETLPLTINGGLGIGSPPIPERPGTVPSLPSNGGSGAVATTSESSSTSLPTTPSLPPAPTFRPGVPLPSSNSNLNLPEGGVSTSNQPLIFETSTNALGRQLRPNDILQVRMRGEQSGRATFSVLNVIPEIEMQEVSPGIYEGRVRIDVNTPAVQNGLLLVALERDGQRSTRANPGAVSIAPQ